MKPQLKFVSSERCIPQHPLKNTFSTKFLFKTRNPSVQTAQETGGFEFDNVKKRKNFLGTDHGTVALLPSFRVLVLWQPLKKIFLNDFCGIWYPKGTAQHLQELTPNLSSEMQHLEHTKLIRSGTVFLHLRSAAELGFWFITSSDCNCSKVTAEWNKVPTALWGGHQATAGVARLLCSHTRAAVTVGSHLCWAQRKETKLCSPCTDTHLFFHALVCD